ncbi:MAG TPA: CRTAC1 family protein [Acidobacteriota bacterium]|nr:CRTAC1 family protein [Acidobacteriota bacterium]
MKASRKAASFTAVLLLLLAVFPELKSAQQAKPTAPGRTSPPPATRVPPTRSSPDSRGAVSTISFENVIAGSGVTYVLKNSFSPTRYYYETMIGGAAVLDFNNDGLLDIFFPNGATLPGLEKSDPSYYNRLYRNNGDGTFTDVTDAAGVKGIGYSMGVAAGDYDNDGFVDLYVCGVNYNQLLHNNGDGTFTDVTAKSGTTGIHPRFGKTWAITAGWFDYDNDGFLDLFVNNYLQYSVATAPRCTIRGLPAYCAPNNFESLPNYLYHNNGDGTFTDVSEKSQIGMHPGKGMGIAFADYDNDGFTDVFVSNDSSPNFLFKNKGDGTFEEVAMLSGVAFNENGRTVAGMGADFRDLDNDGKPDIFHTAMFADTFPLYRNMDGQFEDATTVSGLAIPSSRLTAWGTGIFDFDNDGYKDIFASCSAILDNSMEIEHRPFLLPHALFRNNGNFTFTDVAAQAGPTFTVPAAHRGAAFGDFNNDGKVDVVVVVLNGKTELFLNKSKNKNHWLLINLVGTRSNRDGLGTRAKITTVAGTQYNQATTAVGYNSSSDKRIHFGLGSAATVDKIELAWPSGIKQVLTNVKADQVLTIREPK